MAAVFKPYFQVIRDAAYSRDLNAGLDSPVVYTAMHGVGTPYVKEAWRVAGFKVLGSPPISAGYQIQCSSGYQIQCSAGYQIQY